MARGRATPQECCTAACTHQVDDKADLFGRPDHLAQAQHVPPLLVTQALGGRAQRRDLVGEHFERLVVVVK